MAFDVSSVLSGDQLEKLKEAGVDKGTAFLAGKTTSAFTNIGNSAAVSGVGKAAVNGLGVVAAAKAISEDELKAMGEQILAAAVAEASAMCGEVVGKFAKDASKKIMNIPSDIAKATAKHFSSCEEKHDVGYYLKLMNSSLEEEAEKDDEKLNNDVNETKKKNVQEKLSEINELVGEYTAKAAKMLGEVSDYIVEGPDIVTEMVNAKLSSVENDLTKKAQEQYEVLTKHIDEFVEERGKKLGHKLCEKYNKANEEIAKKSFDDVNKAKGKAQTLAASLLQKGKLQIMALTGIPLL